MRRLILFRHAKAEPGRVGGDDFTRVLAPRGEADALAMGERLAAIEGRPSRVICSPATRTQQTWALAALAYADPPPLDLEPTIYEAEPEAILQAIAAANDDSESLLVCGHNPGLEQVVAHLLDDAGTAQWRSFGGQMKTGCIVVLGFADSGWAALQPGSGQLVRILAPGEG
jgi:phosphohistidine phosphatase